MSLLPARAWLAIAGVALAVSLLAWIRHDAAQDARNQVAVEAARTQERIRHEADAKAHDAERAGADVLLRDGRY